jgi:signal transduction histidine kinase
VTTADGAAQPGNATHLPGGTTLSSAGPQEAKLRGMSVSDPPSLQNRLLLRLCAVFVAFFLAAGLVVFLIYHTDSAEIPFDVLNGDLSSLREAVSVNPDGSVAVDQSRLAPAIGYMVRTPDGTIKLIGGRHADELRPGEIPTTDEITQSCRLMGHEHPSRRPRGHQCSLSELVTVNGQTLVLQVTRRISANTTALDALLYEWLGEYLPVTVPMLLALMAALVVTLRGALRPLDRLMRYARSITPAQTGLRLPTEDLPRELMTAVDAVNGALDRLDRGYQAQRDFLADAAHELRTPLAILAAHLDTMDDKSRASMLRADVDRMVRLVNQLLMVAQLEALTIRPEDKADLSELSTELAALLAPLAIRSDRSVAVINADHPVVVRGNRDAIYQALRNLAENALKFTPPGSEVEIEVDRSGAVSVSDRGPGIPKADREHLFRRFWRADRRQSGGAGLGLAIAHRIATAHAGQLAVTDNPGGGARFTLRVPLSG